jgi:hypothetical protein
MLAEQTRRAGAPLPKGGADPAAAETANQEAARVDPSGRSDEAASRAMSARAAGLSGGPKTEPADTRSGERNPGTQSDRDHGDKEG